MHFSKYLILHRKCLCFHQCYRNHCVNDLLHSMLKFFLQLYINDVRIKISFRYIKRKSVAEGFAFKCVSLCYNLLLLSKQQEEIMYYACFVTREDIRFHVSPEWFFWYFLLLMKKHYLSTHNLCYITHDSYHSIGEKIRYANN